MTDLPKGTVTLLFTDIEGSTRLLQQLGQAAYAGVLGDHQRIVREAIATCSGSEVKTEGDSFFAVFPRAVDAITAAVQSQRALAAHHWPRGTRVSVRMGIHTGDVILAGGEYVGLDVHRAARVAAAAHGGQVLVSQATVALAADSLPAGVTLRDLGDHGLRDLPRPERLYQLAIAGLPTDFPPLHTLSARIEQLPPESTTFVGRERELDGARSLLGTNRLLTLTGPGGTGKTRLSLRLAQVAGSTFADGVAFVPLASITDPQLVAPAIRQGLGFAEEPDRSAEETLIERIGDREILLVLDNFEQVLHAAPLVGRLLEGAPGLKVVVTSRSVLHLTGEQEFAVPPLSVPAAADADDLEALSRSEAVSLFVQRARSVRPDFELTTGNAQAVREICSRLDGLPLAIELAAARVKLLPPPALLERLGSRLDLLRSTASDRSDRQRTLRGAIDWSYDLLSADERALFRRLSVFVGGWTLDEMEDVAVAAGPLEFDPLDGLSAMADHSLVRQAGDESAPRYGMLETIREYGREQLEAAGELETTAAAHARAFAALVLAAEPHLTAGPEWLDRLERDHANLRAAVAWLAEAEIEAALAAAGAGWRFWHLRGHLREGSALLSDLLARPSAAAPTRGRAKALLGLAGLVYWRSDYRAARASYEEALAIARQVGDRALEVDVLYSLAYVRAIERDWDGALSAYNEARAIYEELGASLGVAWAVMGIGMVTTLRGDHEAALPIIDESHARFEALGDSFGVRNTLGVSARPLMHLGRLAEARKRNLEHIRLSHAQLDPTSLSAALLDAAALDAIGGRFERAARLVGAAERIIDESGGQAPPELVNRIDPLPHLRRALEAESFERLRAEGRLMSTDEAVAIALQGDGD